MANLSQKSTLFLFKSLEALFQANSAVQNIAETVEKIQKSNKDYVIPSSFVKEVYNKASQKFRKNNEAIIQIEKELNKRIKKEFPSVVVFRDIDQFSLSINEEIEKYRVEEKEEKPKRKGLKKI